jgi:hypothetical protein
MHTISQNVENAEIKDESSFSRTATAIETAQFVGRRFAKWSPWLAHRCRLWGQAA